MFRRKEKEEVSTGKDSKKKRKQKKTKVLKNCLELVPHRLYDDELDAFKLNDGSFMDIFKIIPRDLENISEDELQMELINLVKIFKVIGIDMKFVSVNFPLNTQTQKEVLLHHREKATDSVRIKWIDRQIDELDRVDSGVLTREFYIYFFGENRAEFIKNKELMQKYTQSGRSHLTTEITKKQKIHILSKIANMNTTEDLYSDIDMEESIEKINKDEIDKKLFERIQPKGGVTFNNPSYIQFGDGYVRCLHIYELPTYIRNFWLVSLFNIPNCICTFDISSKDMNEVKKNLNKSISEERSRIVVAKNHEELYDSKKRKEELEMLYDSLSRLGEVIKLCGFRIFIKGRTLVELEERTNEIFKNLDSDGYKTTALLNEQKQEWESLYKPYKKIHQKSLTMKGLTLTSEQLAIGFPFNYSELLDEQGVLLGFSKTGGVILFDPFAKTGKRKHYNAIISGDMGSGKSTHLKKIFKHQASIGNYIRTFDISGEFTKLTNEFGGKIIKCNGQDGILNPLEILKAGVDDSVSYSNHIIKLQTFFKCVNHDISPSLLQKLGTHLQIFYSLYNLVPNENSQITGLPADKYPILSNFKAYLEKQLVVIKQKDMLAQTDVETNLNIREAKDINDILNIVTSLISTHGYMFDGHTSINNITKEKIVTFDISSLKDMGDVFTAQMQNFVSLCWDNAVENGSVMKNLWEDDEIESEDVTKFLFLIDESHRWVNTSMPMILDMIIKYMREARKYFAGLILASQSIRDFMPETTSKDMEKIRVLFEFSQYKFMFKQDSSVKEYIKNIFGYGLTFSQVEKIPFLETGETILSISGDNSIEFKEWLSLEYEEKLFAGGR